MLRQRAFPTPRHGPSAACSERVRSRSGWGAVVVALSLFLAGAALAARVGAERAPRAQATATRGAGEETPVVEPPPLPTPLHLPLVLRGYDRRWPGPVLPEARGYVAGLLRAGREACAPGTHVLLRDPEGTPHNTALAVLWSGPATPDINLDLYIADFVELRGLEDLAPPVCREMVSPRLIEVRAIRAVLVTPRGG